MIEAGDVILFKGTTPIISPLIRWVTDSDYTHVGAGITNKTVYEIDIDRKLAIHSIRDDSYDVFRYKHGLGLEQKEEMRKYAIEQAISNKGYDWLHAFSFGLEKIFRTKRAFQWTSRVICSEIVDNLYDRIGIDLVPGRERGNIAPGHLIDSPELVHVFSYDKYTQALTPQLDNF